MANEMDLYKDLEQAENLFKICINKAIKKGIDVKICRYWKREIKNVTHEIKEKYPDLK